jgi:hypothetical protein
MGYSLNQKCLSKCILRGKGGEKLTEGTRIEVKSEKDIFRILKGELAFFNSFFFITSLSLISVISVPWRRPEERIPS